MTSSDPIAAAPPTTTKAAAIVRIALLIGLIGGAAFAAHRSGLLDLSSAERAGETVARLRQLPALPLLFVLAYAIAASVGLPATAFTLAGGAIFGTVLGSALNWLGATLGAAGAYVVARWIAGDAVRNLIGNRAAKLDRLTANATFLPLFRLRLIPVVPFNALNFAAGLSRVPFRPYLLSTALGIIPGTVVYTYFADSLLAGVTGASGRALLHVGIAAALLIAVSFAPALVGRLRRRSVASIAGLAAVIAMAAPLGAQGASSMHDDFDVLLRRHVVDGLVDYDAFDAAPEFKRYLGTLATSDPERLPPAERLPFWINVYNAYTIQLINSHRERKSIRNINRKFGLRLKGPWSERLAQVGGRSYTLDEIEHEIIRKRFREPRIHFALVCAAIGCPPLRSEAYRADRLEQQLAEQTRRFLRETPAKNRVDLTSRTLHMSPIFKWFAEDFGGSREAIGRFIANAYPAGAERQLLESGEFTMRETEYDWALNKQPR